MAQLSINVPTLSNPFKLKHMALARSYIGVHEESEEGKDNPIIVGFFKATDFLTSSDETHWCAAFVNSVLRDCGYEYTGKPNARSFLKWGVHVPHSDVKVGDVGVIKHGTWQGHVFFVDEVRPNGTIGALGGNQGNEVKVITYDVIEVAEFRRLKSAGTSTTLKAVGIATVATTAPTIINLLGLEPSTVQLISGMIQEDTWANIQQLVTSAALLYMGARKVHKIKSNRA